MSWTPGPASVERCAVLEVREARLVAQPRLDLGVDQAQADPPRRARRDLPVELGDHCLHRQRVADRVVVLARRRAEPVDVEVDVAADGAGRRLEAAVEPQARVADERDARAVLREDAADRGQVRAREAFAPGLVSRAHEQRDQPAAVADRGLGDDHRDRQEAARALEDRADVEHPVGGVDHRRASVAPALGEARRVGRLRGSGRGGDRRDQRDDARRPHHPRTVIAAGSSRPA
jgi:hypothetical protein